MQSRKEMTIEISETRQKNPEPIKSGQEKRRERRKKLHKKFGKTK
jgi:hypothetical protein